MSSESLSARIRAYLASDEIHAGRLREADTGALYDLLRDVAAPDADQGALEERFAATVGDIRRKFAERFHQLDASAQRFVGERVQTSAGPGTALQVVRMPRGQITDVAVQVILDSGGTGGYGPASLQLASELGLDALAAFRLQEAFWARLKDEFFLPGCLANPGRYLAFLETVLRENDCTQRIRSTAAALKQQAPLLPGNPEEVITAELRIILAPSGKSRLGTWLTRLRHHVSRSWRPTEDGHDFPQATRTAAVATIPEFLDEARAAALTKELRRQKGFTD